MSDQGKEHGQRKRGSRIREPEATARDRPVSRLPPPAGADSAATAALALAVSSARQTASAPVDGSKGDGRTAAATMGSPVAPAARRIAAVPVIGCAVATAAAIAVVCGFVGSQIVTGALKDDPKRLETVAALHRNEEDLIRIASDVKALTVALESLTQSVDRARSDASSTQAEVLQRLERSEQAPYEAASKIGQLGAQLDRIESAAKDPAVKFTALSERLDRIERQIAAAAAARPAAVQAAVAPSVPVAGPGPAVAPEPSAQTGSLEQKARDTTVDGWVLHEVYHGIALIESRNRRLIEVGPGEVVPGVGRVEAIEKRGKRWVVVTGKGVIAAFQ